VNQPRLVKLLLAQLLGTKGGLIHINLFFRTFCIAEATDTLEAGFFAKGSRLARGLQGLNVAGPSFGT
jgi:hypothetical protein